VVIFSFDNASYALLINGILLLKQKITVSLAANY